MRGDQKTLVERRDAAVGYFNKAGIPTERILKSLEVSHLDDITLDHLIDLNGMRSALKTGESSLDQLFPVEREPGQKAETLRDKLQMLSTVDPETGEIKESGEGGTTSEPGGTGAETPPEPPGDEAAPVSPATTVNVPQRAKGSRRVQTTQERIQTDGDAAAAKGTHALKEWTDTLSADEMAQISPATARAWREKASWRDAPGAE